MPIGTAGVDLAQIGDALGRAPRRPCVKPPARMARLDRGCRWPSHSYSRDRAARPSAWARLSPRLSHRARECSRRSTRRSARSCRPIMCEGPKDTLTLTENAQPALMAVSMAVMRVLEREKGFTLADKVQVRRRPLARANIRRLPRPARFSLADAARLLKLRGQAMQAAVPVGRGRHGGAAGRRQGRGARSVAADAAQGEVCQVANDNEPTQVVISGAKTRDRPRGADRPRRTACAAASRCNVSAPFHCALMQPAADAMAEALAQGRRSRRRWCRWSPTCWRRRSPIRRDQAAPRRAGDRHRALARVRGSHGGGRRHRRLRDRRRQGAVRPRQAHRADAQCHVASARRPRSSRPRYPRCSRSRGRSCSI